MVEAHHHIVCVFVCVCVAIYVVNARDGAVIRLS